MPLSYFPPFFLLILFACQSETKPEQTNETGLPRTLTIADQASRSARFSEVFDHHYVQPVFGGPYYDISDATGINVKGNSLFVAENSSQPSIHLYYRGKHVKSFYGKREGPGITLSSITDFEVQPNGEVVIFNSGRNQIVLLDSTLTPVRKIETGLYGKAIARVDDGYLIYTSTEMTSNTGALVVVNDRGGIVRELMPIDTNRRYLNFITRNNLRRSPDGSLNFQDKYNSHVFTYRDGLLSARYRLDFGERGIPDSYFENEFANVMEFIEPLMKTDYWHGVNNLIETEQKVAFAFVQGNEYRLALLDKDDDYATTAIISTLNDYSLLPGTELVNHFLSGPLDATTDGYFVFVVPEVELEEQARQHLLAQTFLNLNDGQQAERLTGWDEDFRFALIYAR